MRILFVYYGNPYRRTCGVDVSCCALIEEFTRRGIRCYAAYRYGAPSDGTGSSLCGELVLPNDAIDHEGNIRALAKYVADHQIDIIFNQGGVFEEVTRLCARAKTHTNARLYTMFRSSPTRYLAAAMSPLRAPFIGCGARSVVRQLPRLCSLPILYVRAYRKSRRMCVLAYRASDRVICLSRFATEDFQSFMRSKDSGEKLHAIPNALADITGYPAVSHLRKDKTILFVGRLQNAVKRVDLLLRVWSRVQNHLPEWSLHILGEGRDGQMLRGMAEKLNLRNIHFDGYVEPRPHYQRASILCMTSMFEGFPCVLIEAQSYGVVPIAYASFSAVHDIIDDSKTGILVTPFRIKEYSRKLVDLATNDVKRAKIADNALRKIEMYSPERIGDQWMELFARDGFPVV